MYDPNHSPKNKDRLTDWSRRMDTSAYGEMPTALYRVQPGDDLRSIASYFYGRGDLWVLISLANPGDIHGLRDLRPGKILRIPKLPAE